MQNQSYKHNVSLDTRNHSFNVGIAVDYSPSMALWLGHLAFWSEKNLANNKHIHDSHVWIYDTLEAMGDYFPYFTKNQIENLINNSVKAGLVIKGNYNAHKYDRTAWYALTETGRKYFPHLAKEKYLKRLNPALSLISENSEMLIGEIRNADRRNPTPIPSTDPDTTPICVGADATHTKTVIGLKQQKAEESALESPEAKAIFDEKFSGKQVTMQQIFNQCREHYEQKSLWATKDRFIRWLEREKTENYKRSNPKEAQPEHHIEYMCYVSQFRNDRDRLRLIPADSVPLSYKDWLSGAGDHQPPTTNVTSG